MTVSTHFKREEFSCGCGCGFAVVDIQILELLENIREEFGKPIIIHCAGRCLSHNKSVGSKDTSQHVKGMAVDFHIKDKENNNTIVYDFLDHLIGSSGGLGLYDWGYHIDIRGYKARW